MKNKGLNIIKICLYIIFLTIYFFSIFVNKKFGFEYVNNEITQNSIFYDEEILKKN